MAGGLDLFVQINNAVLDLQASHHQTYERPIKSLARLLQHPDVAAINAQLTHGLDLDGFLEESLATQGGMVGSAQLLWPDEPSKVLGLTLLLIRKFAEDPNYMLDFAHTYYYSGRKIIGDINALTAQLIIPFARDYKAFVEARGHVEPTLIKSVSKRVFIVHGHDDGAREGIARFLASLDLEPVILHEQANRGMTVIEKVEANSDVGFAVVILTADDEGRAKGGIIEPRPRQNVLLELGYFIGRLGRHKVCALKRGELEIPSDFAGVVWETMDANSGWKLALGRELAAAGYQIDWNKVMK
jgi:predicted nucleotide-binding protein